MGETQRTNQNSELNCVDIDSSNSQTPTITHNWNKTDGWFWPFVFLGVLAAMHFGWSLEDVYLLELPSNRPTRAKLLYPQLFSGVIAGTSIFLFLVYFLYSPNTWTLRTLNMVAGTALVVASAVIGIGIFRHDYTEEIIRKYLQLLSPFHSYLSVHHLYSYFTIPLYFLLGSLWLCVIFGPIKLSQSRNSTENAALDQQYQVYKWSWYLGIGVLGVAWMFTQSASLASLGIYLPMPLIGLAIASGLYLPLLLLAMVSARPAGNWTAWIASLIIFLSGSFIAVQFGGSIVRAFQISPKYSTACSWGAAIVSAMFALWVTELFLSGRLPRKLRKSTSQAKQQPARRSPIAQRGFSRLIFGCIVCLPLAHLVPYCYDLPIAIAGKGSSHNHAKLLAELRRISRSLRLQKENNKTARFQFPEDLADSALVFVSTNELETNAWMTMTKKWQQADRLPVLSATDTVFTIERLKLLERSPDALSIDGAKISSKNLNLQLPTLKAVGWEERELQNTHVDQAWIDYLAQFEFILKFTNCTFDENLVFPNSARHRYVQYYGRLDDQQLANLSNLAPDSSIQFGPISNIQLTAKGFERLLSQTEIYFETKAQSPNLDNISQEVENYFCSRSYPERLTNYAKKHLNVSENTVSIRRFVYGESIGFPANEDNETFETDANARIIRYTHRSNSQFRSRDNLCRVRLNDQAMRDVQTLEINNDFLVSFFIRPFEMRELRVIRFTSMTETESRETTIARRISKLLSHTEQSNLRALEFPATLENILPQCQPWPELKSLAVVLRTPPSLESLNQIKTATKLEQLVIFSPDLNDYSADSISQHKQLWTDCLKEADINVPTTLVWEMDQLTIDKSNRELDDSYLAPIELDIGTPKSD